MVSPIPFLHIIFQCRVGSCRQSNLRAPFRGHKARFKRSATAAPNSIDRIKFDFGTAVARRLKPSRATRQ